MIKRSNGFKSVCLCLCMCMCDARTVNRCSFEFFICAIHFFWPLIKSIAMDKKSMTLIVSVIESSGGRCIHRAKEAKNTYCKRSWKIKNKLIWHPEIYVIASDNSRGFNQCSSLCHIRHHYVLCVPMSFFFLSCWRNGSIYLWQAWKRVKSTMFNKQRLIRIDQIKTKRWRLIDINH